MISHKVWCAITKECHEALVLFPHEGERGRRCCCYGIGVNMVGLRSKASMTLVVMFAIGEVCFLQFTARANGVTFPAAIIAFELSFTVKVVTSCPSAFPVETAYCFFILENERMSFVYSGERVHEQNLSLNSGISLIEANEKFYSLLILLEL
ncbi:hypothetical protein F0562_006251 [Nyssa sinensis]|uniref:Uncharacterized protein n=1 Tax=Nyssa sinensis TaxID=561372 RepID=A0A5J5AP65_9ASTE|nr:hypothetical protein F0562_006251 [Nyssa sinensis]